MLGDEAFPLHNYLMKPYARRNNLTLREKVYKYRHSRARHIVENAFGIMACCFWVFWEAIQLSPDTVIKLVTASCALHNWIRKSGYGLNPMSVDIENYEIGNVIPGSWRYESRIQAFICLENKLVLSKIVEKTFVKLFIKQHTIYFELFA